MEKDKNIPPEQTPAIISKEIVAPGETVLTGVNQHETSSPGEEAVVLEIKAIDQSQEKNDREVHHHSHAHSADSHRGKKWKSYFWEFLMLFLAVFCGFLAEYQLEHKIEKDRELQYIKSMTYDLLDDEKSLDAMIRFEQLGIAQLDTVIDLLNDPGSAKQSGGQLYYVARVGPRSQPFANNSRTFDQLRNSGGFRLINNASASNNIMGYYEQFSPLRLLEDNYNHEFDNYKRVAAKIFDPGVLRRQETINGEILRDQDNHLLRTYDAELLKELSFHTLQMNGSRRGKIVMLQNLRKTAGDLVLFLKNTYHLE